MILNLSAVLKDFYSAHGQDAKLIATTFFKTQHVLKNLGSGTNALPSCTLSMSNGKSFLRQALTSQQLKVQIWGGGTKKSNTWTVQKEVGDMLTTFGCLRV